MKKLSIFIAFALLIFQNQPISAKTKINQLRVQQTETRPVSPFTGILSSGNFNVIVNIGSEESLRIEGNAEDMDDIETLVANGVLKLRVKNPLNRLARNMGKVNIYITAKSLNALAISGSGSMKIEGVIKGQTLNTSVSGAGSMNFNADVTDFKAVISGSGSMNVAGTGSKAFITVSGSGSFTGKNFHTNTTEIIVSGAGDATIHAENELSAILSGSGNIRYSGDPKVEVTKSGSGSISKI
jgi:hypothetical protein